MKPISISITVTAAFILLLFLFWFGYTTKDETIISVRVNAVNNLQLDGVSELFITINSISLRQSNEDWEMLTYLDKDISLQELQNRSEGALLGEIPVKNMDYDLIRLSITDVFSAGVQNDLDISIPNSDIDIPISPPSADEFISEVLFSINAGNSLQASPDRSSAYVFLPDIQFSAWTMNQEVGSSSRQVYIKSHVHIDDSGDLRYGSSNLQIEQPATSTTNGVSGGS